MPLLEINQSRCISASVRLDETTAEQVDQYAAFVHASADDVVDKALNYVFSKDREFQDFLKTPQARQVASTLRIRRGPSRDGKDAAEQPAKKLVAGVESTASVRVGPHDRVLLIGDTRQHQAVDAGKPFEQLQDAGMRTAQLDQIVRQRDPELLKAVEHLARNETHTGISLLQAQGRITEISNPQERIAAIARDYASNPEKTLIVSPDNASRRDINQAVRTELQASGALGKENVSFPVLVARNDMTGADRAWAAKYNPGDTVQYIRGSQQLGLGKNSYATVVATDPANNRVTVARADGQHVVYDPQRLRGVNVYTNLPREFSTGDRIQFTHNNKDLDVHNRDRGRNLRLPGLLPHHAARRGDRP
jgi:hypothetical protein